jgi:hypothetical protein
MNPTYVYVKATHHSCDLFVGSRRVAPLPGAVGKLTTKKPRDWARDREYNLWLGRVWMTRIETGGTRFNPAIRSLVANATQ